MRRIDIRILQELSAPLEICSRPFLKPASRLGVGEAELLKALREIKNSGVMRRVGAVLNHKNAGFEYNALVAWKIKKNTRNKIGRLFSKIPSVSHCYLRCPASGWPYSLYTMVHAKSSKERETLIRQMAVKAKAGDYRVLRTVRELKKTKQSINGIWA
jgi:DNA-binding Lrp family transcriptional regulator